MDILLNFLQQIEAWQAVAVLAGVLAAALILVKLGNEAYNFLLLKQGYANEEKIERFLLPALHAVITSIYEFADEGLDLAGRVITSIDKQRLAQGSYDLVKDFEVNFGFISVKVGSLISEDRWVQYVEQMYSLGKEWYYKAADEMLKQLKPTAPV